MCLQWRRRRPIRRLSLHQPQPSNNSPSRNSGGSVRRGFQASLRAMPRESKPRRRARAQRIARKLFAAHPDAHCALDHRNAFELLCATVLSAQCTDERVNLVTPALFKRFPDAKALSSARPAELEKLIKSTGFYKNKTKSLLGFARALVESHSGRVPSSMEELVELPGVGRKTANVI